MMVLQLANVIAVSRVKKDGILGRSDNNNKKTKSMKNSFFKKKCVAILALCVSAYCSCFAQGGVVTYATGKRWFNNPNNVLNAFSSNDQLNRLTHVIAMGIYIDKVCNVENIETF